MKRLRWFLVILSLGPSACTKGPKGLSRPTYAATETAVATLQRADEIRDAGNLTYEPQFLDAEKAVDRVKASAKSQADHAAADVAGACAGQLVVYRETLEEISRASARKPSREQARAIQDLSALHERITGKINSCISELRSFLQ